MTCKSSMIYFPSSRTEGSSSSASSAFDSSPAHGPNPAAFLLDNNASPQLPPKMSQHMQQQQQQQLPDGSFHVNQNNQKSSHPQQQQQQQQSQYAQLRYNTVQPTSHVRKKDRKSVKSLFPGECATEYVFV